MPLTIYCLRMHFYLCCARVKIRHWITNNNYITFYCCYCCYPMSHVWETMHAIVFGITISSHAFVISSLLKVWAYMQHYANNKAVKLWFFSQTSITMGGVYHEYIRTKPIRVSIYNTIQCKFNCIWCLEGVF